MRGAGRVVFAGILLIIAGTLNIIYGIAAIDDANFFVGQTHYVFSSLHTWGWITLIVGIIELTGGFSCLAGHTYGRVIGIIGGTLGALASILSINDGHPFYSLAIFALCVIVVHGLVVFGEDGKAV